MEEIWKLKDIEKLEDDEILLLSKRGFNDPETLQKPRFNSLQLSFLY